MKDYQNILTKEFLIKEYTNYEVEIEFIPLYEKKKGKK